MGCFEVETIKKKEKIKINKRLRIWQKYLQTNVSRFD